MFKRILKLIIYSPIIITEFEKKHVKHFILIIKYWGEEPSPVKIYKYVHLFSETRQKDPKWGALVWTVNSIFHIRKWISHRNRYDSFKMLWRIPEGQWAKHCDAQFILCSDKDHQMKADSVTSQSLFCTTFKVTLLLKHNIKLWIVSLMQVCLCITDVHSRALSAGLITWTMYNIFATQKSLNIDHPLQR